MAFERNSFLVAKKVALQKSEFTVECNVKADCEVQKILSISADACMQGLETTNGSLNYSGIIDLKVVFKGDDLEINTICSVCPFSSKFESDEITNGQDGFVTVKVIDYSIEHISNDSIKINVFIEQSGFVVGNQEVNTIKNSDDSVCVKNDVLDIIRYVGNAKHDHLMESEINIREGIKKVVLAESDAVIKSVDAGKDYVTVLAEVVSRVLYVNENDKFESGYVYDSFKEEIELQGVTKDSIVDGNICIKKEGLSYEIVKDEKGEKVLFKVPLLVNVYGFEKGQITIINDLYSTKCDVKVSTQSFTMSSNCPMEVVEGKIEGSVTLDDNRPRVDKLLFNGGNSVTVTNSYIKDGEIYIEGIAKTSVVYLNDEESSLHSVQLDIPFTLSDKFDYEDGGIININAIVTDVDVVVKKGREFYYDAKVKASVSYCEELVSGVISEAVDQECYPEKDFAMEVIFARAGKDLWDIAKEARVKQEQIVMQNPEIIFPVEKDTSLVLFYQRLS